MMSVECKLAFAFDHCFATGKSYCDPGIVNTFNVTNKTGQMMDSFCCKSAAIIKSAHAIEQMTRCPWFQPLVYYSNIYPKGKEFWSMMVGPDIVGRLGMFHFFQRIVKTLRDGHEYSKAAIKELKMAIYKYNPDDLCRLLEVLKDGLMGNKKKKHTPQDIGDMMYTREWKDKYDKYLMKEIHLATMIEQRLNVWFRK